MQPLLTIVAFEWRENLFNRRFWKMLLLSLLVPGVVGCGLMSLFTSVLSDSTKTGFFPGVVDESRQVTVFSETASETYFLHQYGTLDEALADLEAGEIPLVFQIPPNFPEDTTIRVYHRAGAEVSPPYLESFRNAIEREMQTALSPTGREASPVAPGVKLTYQVMTTQSGLPIKERPAPAAATRTWPVADWMLYLLRTRMIVPILVGMSLGFSFAVTFFWGRAVHREAREDVLEILLTSVSPLVFLNGKVLGVWSAGLTLSLWLFLPALMIAFSLVEPEWRGYLAAMLLLMMVSSYATNLLKMFFAYRFRMRSFSVRAVESLFLVFSALPVILMEVLLRSPNGGLAVAFSIFPETAFTALWIRLLAIPVPWSQMAAAGGAMLLWIAGIHWWIRRSSLL